MIVECPECGHAIDVFEGILDFYVNKEREETVNDILEMLNNSLELGLKGDPIRVGYTREFINKINKKYKTLPK